MSFRRLSIIGLLVILLGIGLWSALPYLNALSFILRTTHPEGWAAKVARWNNRAVTERIEEIPTRHETLKARLYSPHRRIRRTVLLVSGVHPAGIDEPRLIRIAREAAAGGTLIVTPELPEQLRFKISARSTEAIEEAALWLSRRRDLAPDGRIGLVGISFSGGLAVVAAGRKALRPHVSFVVSIGGHGDLPRVLRYFCSESSDDYGLAVFLLNGLHRLVPSSQVKPLEEGLLTYLKAVGAARSDAKAAAPIFEEARSLEKKLPEPARKILRSINERQTKALAERMLPYAEDLGGDPDLSPERSPAPTAPVYLLHGSGDSIIPPTETLSLAESLQSETRVRVLVTPFLTHADLKGLHDLTETWKLVSFWTGILKEGSTSRF